MKRLLSVLLVMTLIAAMFAAFGVHAFASETASDEAAASEEIVQKEEVSTARKVISTIGALIGCVFLTWAIYKGLNMPITSIIVAIFIAITSGVNVQTAWESAMESAVIPQITNITGVYLFGGILGYLYSESGAASRMALTLFKPFSSIKSRVWKQSCYFLAFFILRFLLGLAGLDPMAAMITLIAISVTMFHELDVPRKYVNVMLTLAGTVTALMPWVPQMYNIIIPIFIPGFTASSLAGIRILWIVVIIITSIVWMNLLIARDRKKGFAFEMGHMQQFKIDEESPKPNFFISLIPLAVILILYNFFGFSAWLATACGVVVAAFLFYRFLDLKQEGRSPFGVFIDKVNRNSLIVPLYMVLSGLVGGVITLTPCYDVILAWADSFAASMPLPIGFGIIAMLLILMGNSALFVIAQIANAVFIPAGMTAGMAGVVLMMSNTVFDSLPNAPGIIMQAELTDSPLRVSYPPIFKLTVILTAVIMMFFCLLLSIGLVF